LVSSRLVGTAIPYIRLIGINHDWTCKNIRFNYC